MSCVAYNAQYLHITICSYCTHEVNFYLKFNYTHEQKQPNLKLKTRPKQLLGYLALAFAISDVALFLQ